MAAINIREGRRAQHPASKYDGVNSFEDGHIPVAYTADQLMKQLVKREAENSVPEDESARRPSYMDDMLAGAVPGLQSVDYEQYKPKQEYSYADRLAMLRSAAPESRAAILELTAPRQKKMKKGLGAFMELLSPALKTGFSYANERKSAYEQARDEAKRAQKVEDAKDAKKMQKEYLKGLLKKEANAEKLISQRELAEIKSGATRYAADRAYEGKKFGKQGDSSHGTSDLDDINAEIENTNQLLDQVGNKGRIGFFDKINPFRSLSPEQAATKAQEHALKLKIAKHMSSNRNQTEFAETPSISSRDNAAANKAVIQQLRKNFNKNQSVPSKSKFDETPAEAVMMRNSQGKTFKIPANEAKEAIADGLRPIK